MKVYIHSYIYIVITYMRISMYNYNYNIHKTNMYVQNTCVYKFINILEMCIPPS